MGQFIAFILLCCTLAGCGSAPKQGDLTNNPNVICNGGFALELVVHLMPAPSSATLTATAHLDSNAVYSETCSTAEACSAVTFITNAFVVDTYELLVQAPGYQDANATFTTSTQPAGCFTGTAATPSQFTFNLITKP